MTALGPSGRLVTDYSPYRQHAALTAGVTLASWSRGWSANYTGSTGATLGYSEHLHTGFPFSVAAWVKYVGAGSSGREIFHSDTDTGTTNYWGFSLGAVFSGTLNQDIFLARYGNGTTANRTLRVSGPAALVIDDWYHVVISIRAHITGDIYINGVSSGSVWGGSGTGLAHNAGTARLGYDTRTSRAWTNEIADVRTWGRAITEAEVRELYSGGPGYGLRPPRRRTLLLAPAIAITGSGSAAVDNASATATGGVTISGTAAITLQAATASASGTQTVRGRPDITLQAATASASGTQTVTGTAAITLETATASASGSGSEAVTGTAAITLEAAAASASGQATESTSGVAHCLLGTVTATASGAVTATGAVAITSGTVSSASSGLVDVTGTVQGTAGALCVATGFVGSGGAVTVTTSGVGVVMVGSVGVGGTVAVTTGAATVTSSGLVPVTDLTLSGSIGVVAVAGKVDVPPVAGKIAVETIRGQKLWR